MEILTAPFRNAACVTWAASTSKKRNMEFRCLVIWPSRRRLPLEAISKATRRSTTQQAVEQIVAQLNRQTVGWANYLCLGPVSKAYRAVERHTCRRLRQWLRAKHKRKGAGTKRHPDQVLHDQFGLVRLTTRTASFPWATP